MSDTGNRLRIVYTPAHQAHQPKLEISRGIVVHHPEVPERVEVIRQALEAAGYSKSFCPPQSYPLELASGVHSQELIAFFQHVCGELQRTGGCLMDTPKSISPDTPLYGNTLDIAWQAACVALTAADLVLEGMPVAYALERPPGHHSGRSAYGGYCYINHAALAAQRLSEHGRVAILDIDFHHGNGTQEIFYDSAQVLYVSIHGHPAWAYPRFSGWAEESGEGAGKGYTLNLPLGMFTKDGEYLQVLEKALDKINQALPKFLVLSAGFDTRAGDPVGAFSLTDDCYFRIGEQLEQLGLPIVVVQEGGYDLEGLGKAAVALVQGLTH